MEYTCAERLILLRQKSTIFVTILVLVSMVCVGIMIYTSNEPIQNTDNGIAKTTTTPTEPILINNNKSLQCQYRKYLSSDGTAQEQLNIYIPCKVGYWHILFAHDIKDSINCNIWRLKQMTAVDDTFNKRYDITNTGEFEAAVRLDGRDDFSGGYQHGDEALSALAIYVDGTPTELCALSERTVFTELTIVRDSLFYDPADHTTEIAEHHVEYVINQNGISTDQYIQWLISETCRTSYMAMFPLLRTTTDVSGSTAYVSEQYTDNNTTEAYDISSADKSEYPQTWKTGVKQITLSSESLGLTAALELLRCTNIPGSGYSQCSPAAAYNKLYFSITGFGKGTYYDVSVGERWETTAQYTVTIEK